MQQVVLDESVLIQACLKGQNTEGIQDLFKLARDRTITLWIHPHAVSHALARSKGGHDALIDQIPGFLESVRLLPAPGAQLGQALDRMQRQSDPSSSDIILLLTIIAAREYLEDFYFVSLDKEMDALGEKVLSPKECLDRVNGAVAEQTPFVDLKAQQHEILATLEANVFEVVKSCRFILGPEVQKLEQRLCEYVQMEHTISCSSGTEALVLALLSLEIGPGDAVFTTPFTFIATAGAIRQVGATPVFVDIDPRTFNLDPEKLESAISALESGAGHPLPQSAEGLRPRAVITVDLFGLPADHHRISDVADRHGLMVIEDAAQSFGGEERGRKACALGEIGCTSFFPAKPLGAYGEGGACFTNNAALAEAMRSIRVHGQGTSRYEHARLGTNARLDSLQAAVLLAKMDIFPEELQRRSEKAAAYSRLLTQATRLRTPVIPEGFSSAWAQYSLLAVDETHRNACQQALRGQGIPTMVYYPIPLHLQRVFTPLGYTIGDFPVSEETALTIFSLPMHPYLPAKIQERIASTLHSVDAGP